VTTRSEASRNLRFIHSSLALKEPDAGKLDNRVAATALLELWPELVNGPKFAPAPAGRAPVNSLGRPYLAEGMVHGFRAGDKP
jgi:hypothetical protein